MKRNFLYAVVLCLCLAGCSGASYPQTAADGAEWNPDWLTHGNLLGVEAPEGVSLVENYAILTMNGLTTSVWGVGTPETVADEDGKEADYYQAQIYVLAKECADEDEAAENLADWAARLAETWSVTGTRDAEYNGQVYAVLDCASVAEDSPYSRELAALGRYGVWAVCVELDCRETFSGDADAVLSEFLSGCHYNAALR